MRYFTVFVFTLFFTGYSFAAELQPVRLVYKKKKEGYTLYVNNDKIYPVSILLELKLYNLVFSEGVQNVFVVPPKSETKIGELIAKNDDFGFDYNYKWRMGDVTIKDYDSAYIYDLPFHSGNRFSINQGYNGTFSHNNEKALDFLMPEGTEILAVRDGIVVDIVDSNSISCPAKECEKYNNYITIMHSDGTFAHYAHISQYSSRFKLGDTVKKGEVIANSGNVGYSEGPHLHFSCFISSFDGFITIETKFKIGKGNQTAILKEGNEYLRLYN